MDQKNEEIEKEDGGPDVHSELINEVLEEETSLKLELENLLAKLNTALSKLEDVKAVSNQLNDKVCLLEMQKRQYLNTLEKSQIPSM